MSHEETLGQSFGKFFNSVNQAVKKVSEAFQEEMAASNSLLCIKEGVLDFHYIESDIAGLHKQLKRDGHKVLGSHVLLNDRTNSLVIKVYTRQGKENFVNTVTTPVKLAVNIPPDIAQELKQKGHVEFNVKPDVDF
ncbi:hypothetical protein [Aerosakkonema funiforme]|uniref:hypothetical protein n=1 Tax=Aerosakkonema funiforme TaxID=1246630 RepID=UPI0035B75410